MNWSEHQGIPKLRFDSSFESKVDANLTYAFPYLPKSTLPDHLMCSFGQT